MIQLRTLGGLELTSSAGTSLEIVLKQPKRTALLCYLALASRMGFCRRDTVLAMFWPDHDPDQARHALRQSLYFLRRSLGPGVLVSRGDDALGIAGGICCDGVQPSGTVSQRLVRIGADFLKTMNGLSSHRSKVVITVSPMEAMLPADG